MGTRQYIGARYVPKFASPVEWDNVRSYEAMTIVTHLGNSYTSKIPVPAGVDIENGEYWVNTGNYNAQVAEYANKVDSLKKSVGCVYFEEYGAVGDGVTDDTVAIKAAVSAAQAANKGIASRAKTYLVSDTISIDTTAIPLVDICGTIKGAFINKPVVIIGNDNKETIGADITCNAVGTAGFGGYPISNAGNDWVFNDINMVGVLLKNISHSTIRASAYNCGVGVRLLQTVGGCVFNVVTLFGLYNNVIGLDLLADGDAWVNDNLFFNGNFQIDSEYSAVKNKTICIRLSGKNHAPNNNVFIKPSFETGGLPVYVVNGSYNRTISARMENGEFHTIAKVDAGRYNIFDSGYGEIAPAIIGAASGMSYISTPAINACSSFRSEFRWEFDASKVFSTTRPITNFADNADVVDTSGSLASPTTRVVNTNETSLVSERCLIGRLFDCSMVKKFAVRVPTDTVTVWVRFYDANKSPLGNTVTPERGVWTASVNAFWIASTTSPDSFWFDIIAPEEAKYVFIGLNGRVREFEVYSNIVTKDKVAAPLTLQPRFTDVLGVTTVGGDDIYSSAKAGAFIPSGDYSLKTENSKTYYLLGYGNTSQGWKPIKAYQS